MMIASSFPRRTTRGLAALVTAAGLVLAMPGGTAHADCLLNPNSGVHRTDLVDGEWYYRTTLNRDFEDHRQELGHSLCYGCADSWNTDLVMMWQAILFAEGFLGSPVDIDGQFGSETRAATVQWQKRYGITADGVVGAQTWRTADDHLGWTSDGAYVYYYKGRGWVRFTRGGWIKRSDNGAYQLVEAASPSDVRRKFDSVADCAPRIQFYRKTVL